MPATNFQPHATRTSWVTGIATQPDKKCVRCKTADATEWISYEYTTGRKGRLAIGYRPVCAPCAEPYCQQQNAKAARAATKPLSLHAALAQALRPQPTPEANETQEKA